MHKAQLDMMAKKVAVGLVSMSSTGFARLVVLCCVFGFVTLIAALQVGPGLVGGCLLEQMEATKVCV